MNNNNNMNNMQTPEPKKKNNSILIPIIAGAVAVFLIAVVVILAIIFGVKKDSAQNATSLKKGQIPATIEVVKSNGSESKTTKAKISVRDVKFGDKIKSVKKFEKTQEDTLDNPSQASTKDGYTYLTYTYSTKAKFFGVKPANPNAGSLLQYVFKDKKLFDIRIQLGDLKKADLKKVSKYLNKKYGKPTHSITYSNKSWQDSWRTYAKNPEKQTLLQLNYSPYGGTVVSYESVKR